MRFCDLLVGSIFRSNGKTFVKVIPSRETNDKNAVEIRQSDGNQSHKLSDYVLFFPFDAVLENEVTDKFSVACIDCKHFDRVKYTPNRCRTNSLKKWDPVYGWTIIPTFINEYEKNRNGNCRNFEAFGINTKQI